MLAPLVQEGASLHRQHHPCRIPLKHAGRRRGAATTRPLAARNEGTAEDGLPRVSGGGNAGVNGERMTFCRASLRRLLLDCQSTSISP